MRSVLAAWVEAQANALPTQPMGDPAPPPRDGDRRAGHPAAATHGEDDLGISFQLRPDTWGHGYVTEAASALIEWAFTHDDVDELLAGALPDNAPAIATTRWLGMHWVGETDTYYNRALQVYGPARRPWLCPR